MFNKRRNEKDNFLHVLRGHTSISNWLCNHLVALNQMKIQRVLEICIDTLEFVIAYRSNP